MSNLVSTATQQKSVCSENCQTLRTQHTCHAFHGILIWESSSWVVSSECLRLVKSHQGHSWNTSSSLAKSKGTRLFLDVDQSSVFWEDKLICFKCTILIYVHPPWMHTLHVLPRWFCSVILPRPACIRSLPAVELCREGTSRTTQAYMKQRRGRSWDL